MFLYSFNNLNVIAVLKYLETYTVYVAKLRWTDITRFHTHHNKFKQLAFYNACATCSYTEKQTDKKIRLE